MGRTVLVYVGPAECAASDPTFGLSTAIRESRPDPPLMRVERDGVVEVPRPRWIHQEPPDSGRVQTPDASSAHESGERPSEVPGNNDYQNDKWHLNTAASRTQAWPPEVLRTSEESEGRASGPAKRAERMERELREANELYGRSGPRDDCTTSSRRKEATKPTTHGTGGKDERPLSDDRGAGADITRTRHAPPEQALDGAGDLCSLRALAVKDAHNVIIPLTRQAAVNGEEAGDSAPRREEASTANAQHSPLHQERLVVHQKGHQDRTEHTTVDHQDHVSASR